MNRRFLRRILDYAPRAFNGADVLRILMLAHFLVFFSIRSYVLPLFALGSNYCVFALFRVRLFYTVFDAISYTISR